MQYILTEDQRDNFLQIMRNNMQDPDAYDAIAEIESLPKLEDEYPIAVDDVTPKMMAECNNSIESGLSTEEFAAAVNAYLGAKK